MTKVLLKGGPCDPRNVEMVVTLDAETIGIRPMPFTCYDVYAVTERFNDFGELTHATGQYLYTDGPRKQVDDYRRAVLRLGTGRAFAVKRKKADRVH